MTFEDESALEETAHKERNAGTKSSVLSETINLLDDFYAPFNKRLAMLLNDRKWLFERKN